MRIAYISYECPPDSCHGGIATYIGQISRVMATRGWDVEVFASSPTRHATVGEAGITYHWIREVDHREFGVAAGRAFANRHREAPFDVVEGPDYNADAREAKRLVPEVPLVLKMHTPSLLGGQLGFNSTEWLATRPFRLAREMVAAAVRRRRPRLKALLHYPLQPHIAADRIERRHACEAAIVAPPCRDLCRYATERWGIDPARIRLTPHPYEPRSGLVSLAPRERGSVVGFVGRLERRKGVEVLAKAIPTVCRMFPEARFRFIGAVMHHPGTGVSYTDWILQQAGTFADRVEFIGKLPLESMDEAYADLDICVFPSVWENFPNVCLEAMSAARGVIGSAAGGMNEMLAAGRAGLTVPPTDARALANAIMRLLENPQERITLGHAARARVLQEYNKDVIGDLMDRVYREAIAVAKTA